LPVNPDEHLVVTCGSTEAMMVAMMTACNPGDKVIVFSPFDENYVADAILSGAQPIYVHLLHHLQLALENLLDHRVALGLCARVEGSHSAGTQGARDRYASARDVFLGFLRQTGLPFTEPQGTYYVLVDISCLGFQDDTEAAEWFVREIGVAGVPGSSFFREREHRFIRFHFAKGTETLRAAGERLLRLSSRTRGLSARDLILK
jgi:aspartate/methionine/tyrosine aminotransferase